MLKSGAETNSPRLGQVDVLRGLAAASVCLFHFCRGGFLQGTPVQTGAQLGYLGVDAFFVISGFVIPYALWRAGFTVSRAGHFLGARFLRLYPAYAIAGLATIGLWYVSASVPGFRGAEPHLTARQLWANAALACDAVGEPWLIPVFWTLAIEAQYYLAIALTFPWLTERRPWIRAVVLACWVAAPLGVGVPLSLFRYAALFGLGIVAFLQAGRLATPALAAIAVAAAVGVEWMTGGVASAMVGLASYLAIVHAPAVKSRLLLGLGAISYSLYLVHVPVGGRVINLAERFLTGPAARFGAVLLAYAASLLAAAALCRWVERPSHDWARRLAKRARPVPGRGAAKL